MMAYVVEHTLKLVQLLIEPAVPLSLEQRRHARLLMSSLLVLSVAICLGQVIYLLARPNGGGTIEIVVSVIFLLIAYFLCRYGYLRVAVFCAMILPFPAMLSIVVQSNDPENTLAILSFLVIPLLVGSTFLSLLDVVFVAVFYSVGLLFLPYFAQVTYSALFAGEIPFLWIVTALILVLNQHRKAVENERQEALLASEQRYKYAIEATSDGLWDWDFVSGAGFFSSRWCEILGYSFADPQLLHTFDEWFSRVHPDDVANVSVMFAGNCDVDYRHRHRSGEYRWQNLRSLAILGPTGKPVRIIGAIRDITDRKQAEADLQRMNQELERRVQVRTAEVQDLYEKAPVGYHSLDEQGRIIIINQTELDWLGYQRDELLGNLYIDLLTPESEKIFWESFHLFKEQGVLRDLELDILRKDGTILPALVSALAVYDENGRYVFSRSTVFDNTERKEAQTILRRREREYASLVENTPDLIARFDTDLRYTYCNPMFERLGSRSINAYLGRTILEVGARKQESVIALDRAAHLVLETGEIQQVEHDLLTKVGFRHYQTRVVPEMDESGRIVSLISVGRDITAHKDMENALRESQANLQTFLDTASDLIQSLDENGQYLYVNNAWCETLNYTLDEARNLSLEQVVSPADIANYKRVLQELSVSRQPEMLEVIFLTRSGQPVMLEGNLSPMLEKGDRLIINGFFRNITQRKQAEDVLRKANVEMERALRMKDEFLASMSHELRTPLTGILGLSEALQMGVYGSMTPMQEKTLSTIEDSGHHLLDLINDILDLSKIEAGMLELQFTSCAINDICQSSLQLIRGMAQKKQQQVEYSINVQPLVIRADVRRVKQMLVNLLSNAVKFTPEGGSLGLQVHASEPDQMVSLTVWDKGMGIAQSDLPKLFKPFVQLDSSLARLHSGTGLGLSLVQRMAEMHGGSVRVESIPGEGSRFTLQLPWIKGDDSASFPTLALSQTSSAPKSFSRSANTPPLVLIAEDNEITLGMLAEYLSAQGFLVRTVSSGTELIDSIFYVIPDIVLMDIQMPGLDGLAAMRFIRAHEDLQIAQVPIIALTALAMAGDRESCLSAGANEYMSKPVELIQLNEMIQKLLT